MRKIISIRHKSNKIKNEKNTINQLRKKRTKKINIIKLYFAENIREYAIVAIMFLIGIFIGVMYINNIAGDKEVQVQNYINNYVQNLKQSKELNYFILTKTAIKKNLVLSLMLWFAGTTIIGIPIVLGIILFRGATLGVSIASLINTLGLGKGLSFAIMAMFLQNIIFIPAIITIGVSSLNLYKAIVKNRKKQSIKLAIFKHTLLSLAMLGIMILSAIIEINISCKILQNFIKYF